MNPSERSTAGGGRRDPAFYHIVEAVYEALAMTEDPLDDQFGETEEDALRFDARTAS